MKREQLKAQCVEVIAAAVEFEIPADKARVYLVIPKGWKPPPKFPRGELLQEKENGDRLRLYPAARLLSWVETNWEMLPRA